MRKPLPRPNPAKRTAPLNWYVVLKARPKGYIAGRRRAVGDVFQATLEQVANDMREGIVGPSAAPASATTPAAPAATTASAPHTPHPAATTAAPAAAAPAAASTAPAAGA